MKKNKMLAELIQIDGMTGLFNHKHSMEILNNEIKNSTKENWKLCIIMADIDNFKKVNDVYGHLIGDEVICKLADTIKSIFENNGFVGRYGGEEFIIIMPKTDIEAAKRQVSTLQNTLESLTFSVDYKVTLSGGLTEHEGELPGELLSITDQKLYMAKRAGKNQFITSLLKFEGIS
ncbi:MAG: GGDEF domain-containing protein [Clostridium sp.]|nr:GGDEF domain-containing protein [Clostridium sp.]